MKNHSLHHSLFSLIAILILTSSSCHHTDEPPEQKAAVQLTAVDTGVVDAMIRLRVSNVNAPYAITLKRDGQAIFTDAHSVADTTILDTALLPKHTYTYKAYWTFGILMATDSSDAFPLTTMDTTSHDIHWTLDTLGNGNSSLLHDVCIVNDTCVYAVGSISVKNSTGNWIYPPYNVAVWNGRSWKLQTSLDVGFLYGDIYSVFAFGENDVWAGSSIPEHWDGQRWTFYGSSRGFSGGFRIYKIWGTSSQDLYFTGSEGNIYHYNGTNFQKLESGTTLDIQDIWGAQDKNGNWEILAAAGNYYVSNQRKILSIKGTTVTTLSDSGIHWALNSVWFMPGKQYWVAGDGMWKKNFMIQTPLWKQVHATTYTTNRVRGIGINDIFICGAYGNIAHFNGVSWRIYDDLTGLGYGQYHSLAAKENLFIAVGDNYSLAVIAMGTRN
jgi:hypothetical protein